MRNHTWLHAGADMEPAVVLERSLFYLLNLKGKIMKKTISVIGLLLFCLGLTACNTMHGFGQDVERGGEKVQGAADKNK
jgi:entericidin B